MCVAIQDTLAEYTEALKGLLSASTRQEWGINVAYTNIVMIIGLVVKQV